MIWLTWRQFRAQTVVAAAALAAFAVILGLTGPNLSHMYAASGPAAGPFRPTRRRSSWPSPWPWPGSASGGSAGGAWPNRSASLPASSVHSHINS